MKSTHFASYGAYRSIFILRNSMCHSKSNKFYHEIQHTQGKSQYFLIGILVSRQKLGIFKLQSPFLGRNSHFVILKMIIVSEYQIKRISFNWNVFDFTQIHKSLFNKNVPYFCQLASVPIYKISTFPLSIEIFMQKFIRFWGYLSKFL